MNTIIRDSFVSVIRQLISFSLGGFLSWANSHNLGIGAAMTVIIGVVAGFMVNVGWAIISALLRKWKVNMALLLEPGATNQQLDAAVNAVPVLQRLQEAVTIPTREQPNAPLAVPAP